MNCTNQAILNLRDIHEIVAMYMELSTSILRKITFTTCAITLKHFQLYKQQELTDNTTFQLIAK